MENLCPVVVGGHHDHNHCGYYYRHYHMGLREIKQQMKGYGRVQYPLCNRRPDSAPHLCGKCFVLCWRCASAAAGALITAGALTCRDFLSEFSPVVHAAVGSALLVPMLIDGGLQYCGNRVSTNWRRALTGSLFGIGVGLIASFLFA